MTHPVLSFVLKREVEEKNPTLDFTSNAHANV
jgi:hypothetical protein